MEIIILFGDIADDIDHDDNDGNPPQVLQQPSISLWWSWKALAWSGRGLDCCSQPSFIWTGCNISMSISICISICMSITKVKGRHLHDLEGDWTVFHSLALYEQVIDASANDTNNTSFLIRPKSRRIFSVLLIILWYWSNWWYFITDENLNPGGSSVHCW